MICRHCARLEAALAQKCGELNTAAVELESARPGAAMFRALWSQLSDSERRDALARVFYVIGEDKGADSDG